jgi:GT2 family glycosyltransferase
VGPSAIPDLKEIEDALHQGHLGSALRLIDRAWRAVPELPALTALYARLLALEARDFEATLRMLQRAPQDADGAALIVDTLLALGRAAEAQAALSRALQQFAVQPDDPLWGVASAVSGHENMTAPGWIGRLPNLHFCGELKVKDTHALHIRMHTGAEFTQPIKISPHGASRRFEFALPPLPLSGPLEITSQRAALLGSGAAAVPDFGVSGTCTAVGRHIQGRVRIAWAAQKRIGLIVQDERGASVSAMAGGVADLGGERCFSLDLKRHGVRGNRIQISARVPTGEWQPLPDMPLLLDDAVRLPPAQTLKVRWIKGGLVRKGLQPRTRRPVDIIIPVYRGRVETLLCIDAVLSTAPQARVVVVDDATDDPKLKVALDEHAAYGRIILLRNERNLGFVASVNRAMAHHPLHDVVLLNSDTQVFGEWLTRLQDAAYSAADVGTVTPFSNSGSIASYPGPGESPMTPAEAAELQELAASTHPKVSAAIPFGVGFCLYVRRDCLTAVGGFDDAVFGKGYGEETDFCLRARALGFSHQLAADVFVHHVGGVSFGAQREALRQRTLRLLNLRHPGFDERLAQYLEADPLRALRRSLDERRLQALEAKFALLVTLGLPGGVDRFVADRSRALRADGFIPLILKPHQASDSGSVKLTLDALEAPNLQYDIPADLDALKRLLSALTIATIEIQHFLGLDARVIEMVRALGTYDVVVHDYAWICPRVTLIDGSGRYCGEPEVSVCTTCVRRHGSNLSERLSVTALRERSARWLNGARAVIAPSTDAAQRLARYIERPIDVRPHSALPKTAPRPRAETSRARIRIALIGAIAEHKGYRVLLDCARDAKRRDLPLEFVVIGFSENDAALRRTGHVFVTGRYVDGEAPHLLRREQPDLIFMASVWPETWCYTLDDALDQGVPILAFDLGAVAERLRAIERGHLLPVDATAARINDEILALFGKTSLLPSPRTAMMKKNGIEGNVRMNQAASAQTDGLSASVQVLPLSAGLYFFSVTSAPAAPHRAAGDLKVPAMHIGLGPGVGSSQVEFVAGPSTEGAWLFAKEDCLVTKVQGSGVTLVLTSVRGPGGETLSIRVARLDDAVEPDSARPALEPPPKDLPPAPARVKSNGKGNKLNGHKLNGHARHALHPGEPKALPAPALPQEPAPVALEIGAHIRTRGDMIFRQVPWAGRIATGMWIESFMVRPLELFQPGDIEYKGLTGSGFETPWLSDGIMCGTKGLAVPLVGFAIRLKRSREAPAYDCEYSGYFKSGVTVGPLKNGNPCRSTVASDPLEGIQVFIRKRVSAAQAVATSAPAGARAKGKGPSFGRFRVTNGHGKSLRAAVTRRAKATKRRRDAPADKRPSSR